MNKTLSFKLGLVLASTALMFGCSSSDDANDTATTAKVAVAVGATADYSTATHALIDSESPYTANINLAASGDTDVTVSGYGEYFYRIARFGANHITKYAASAPEVPIWQCSTEGTETGSNPYQLVQVAEDKAYVLRYGSGKLWIVDPSIASSADCASFKTGEIDLSSFDSDGIPEMSAAVVVGNYLFVAIQRLQNFVPSQKSQVVVIDTATDTVIDTDSNVAGIQPITLPGRNPGSMQYVDSMDRIFVQSVGKYDSTAYGGTAAEYTGGIDVIDPTALVATVLIDDDADITKQISGMAVIDSSIGYFVSYAGWGDNSLYQFNPSTGTVVVDGAGAPVPVTPDFSSTNIAGIHAGPHGKLWVRIDSGLSIVEPGDNSVIESLIDTQMNPSGLVFVDNP